jgi:hypothetical protein
MDYEAERQEARTHYDNARKAAAAAATEFYAATTEVVAPRYRDDVERAVREDHATTGRLSDAQLTDLKRERDELVSTAPAIVQAALDKLLIWTYRSDDPPGVGPTTPQDLSMALWAARAYHKSTPHPNDSSVTGLSHQVRGALDAAMLPLANLIKPLGYRAYLETPKVDDLMVAIFARYSTALDAMYDALARIREIDKAEATENAAARWDKA